MGKTVRVRLNQKISCIALKTIPPMIIGRGIRASSLRILPLTDFGGRFGTKCICLKRHKTCRLQTGDCEDVLLFVKYTDESCLSYNVKHGT